MAFFLAVANRKGGVGKSTVAVMLAHAFSAWGGKRVVIIDLDSQCNASMILLGGEGWFAARAARKTIADYFTDAFHNDDVEPSDYLLDGVGDVTHAGDAAPRISLLTGSLLLDDIQGDLFMSYFTQGPATSTGVRDRFEALLGRFAADFDVVIMDCAPGLSFAALAAISIADKVLVPFRPDYVSLIAVDRVALIIESKNDLDELATVPIDQRRYACLANFVRANERERLLIEEIGLAHPVLATELPHRDGIANAFDWLAQPRSIEQKYGSAIPEVRRLYEDTGRMLADKSVF